MIRPFRFFLERWIHKGIFGQLMLMASLVALVALLGGVAAWATTSQFGGVFEAVWWAFLRLTDPGYLGDDQGAVLRTISTVVTVLGYVLFMGSLIAIMTQWLSKTIKELESGVTPISMSDHVVILGWTNRTPEVILKLLSARGRLQRFLASSDARKLRVVVLAEDAGTERRFILREYLGEHWHPSQVFLRSGSSLQTDHLERLDLTRASVVLIPGADFELGGSDMTDTRVVKTLMTVSSLLRSTPQAERPHVVAEIFDPRKAPIARTTMDAFLEVVASNRIISRLIFQSVRHRGLAQILFGIFSHRQGNSLYLRAAPGLAGHSPRAMTAAFEKAIVLGFLKREGAGTRIVMDPGTTDVLGADDLVIFLADRYDDCVPDGSPPAVAEFAPTVRPAARRDRNHAILVLGWSHKIAALITELDHSGSGGFDITIMSRVSPAERETALKRVARDEGRVRVRNVFGDYSIETDLAGIGPQGFDHVLFLASDWMSSSEAADARTVLGYVLLTTLLEDADPAPEVLVELLDPDNSHLFESGRDVVLVTPRVLSHLLAHVALRPELNAVFDVLFGAGGAEIALWSAADFGLGGRSVSFAEIQDAVFEAGFAALGVFCEAGPSAGIQLNPPRDRTYTLTERDHVVVLAPEG